MELQIIQDRIFTIRGHRVMLDFHLAEMYEVETRVLNQAVSRNSARFPDDFMFQLTDKEWQNMSSQIVMTYPKKRPKVALPYVFTEQGVAMLSSVLRSDRAIKVNIELMRAFVMLRRLVLHHKDIIERIDQVEAKYDSQFAEVFQALKYLLEPIQPEREAIGFKTQK
jgi:ORF6N domain